MSLSPTLNHERPFPGLRPYACLDADWFHGREIQTSALYGLAERNRFTAVVGSSGSGKSSLVRAGLVPKLQAETNDPGGKRWLFYEMRPGDAPMARLAEVLAGPDPGPEADRTWRAMRLEMRTSIEATLRQSSFGISDALGELTLPEGYTVLLLIDQFEEIFRFADIGRSDGTKPGNSSVRTEAAAFVDLLLQAARSPDCAVHVVLTMRSDYLGECARFQGLSEAMTQSQFLVPAMTRDQRQKAICSPIERAGATVQHELVERLLNDGSDELDQLPVLQHTLMRTWEHAGQRLAQEGDHPGGTRELLLADYEAIGGLAEALNIHADEVVADLPSLDTAVEQVFRALAELDREGRAVRRARRFASLYAETGCQEKHLRKVIDRFRRLDCSFLVPPPPAEIENDTVVDIGHEALIRRWKKMSAAPEAAFAGAAGDRRQAGWLWAEAADGITYRTLLELIRGAPEGVNPTLPVDQVTKRLAWWQERPRTAAWTKRYGGDFAAVEKLFADSERKLRRARRNRFVVTGVLIATFLASVGFGGFAAWQWREAAEQRQVAEEQRQIAEQQRLVAEKQAIEAKAGSFWVRLQLFPETLRPDDVKTLWALAASPEDVRVEFVRQLAEVPGLMRQFGAYPQVIARAIGLDWPDAGSQMVLRRIRVSVAGPPDLADDAAVWQTAMHARSIIALYDQLDADTQKQARQFLATALRSLADQSATRPDRLVMIAQMMRNSVTLLDPESIIYLRAKIGAAIDGALAKGDAGSQSGLAIAMAVVTTLPPDSQERNWAAFDYLIKFVTDPNAGFRTGLAARQIGPLVDRLQPVWRGSGSERGYTDVVEALLGTVAALSTEDGETRIPLTLIAAVDPLAAKLQNTDPAQIDERIARALAAYEQPYKRAALARAAAALAAGLGGGKLPASVPMLADIVIGGRNDANVDAYAAALWAIAGSGDVPPQSLRPLFVMLQPIERGERGYRAAALARVLAIRAARLPPVEANELADAALEALRRPSDPFAREGLANLLLALAPQLDATRRDDALTTARLALAEATAPEEAESLGALTARLLPATNDDELLRTTTEILKYPTVAGTPTDAILDVLETRLSPARLPPVKHLKDMPVPSLAAWLRQQKGIAPYLAAQVLRPGSGISPYALIVAR